MRVKSFLSLICMFVSLSVFAEEKDFDMQIKDSNVSFVNKDGSASASLRILYPVNLLSTTKSYAQYVMDKFSGWGLTPVLDLRGFSFKYVDNAPCAGLLTYFDGRSFLLFTSCGKIDPSELHQLYLKADKELRISEKIKRENRPILYK